MKKNKITIMLIMILVILISIIIFLLININDKKSFVKPEFDKTSTTSIPENINYKKSGIKITDGYSIYIEALPKKTKDNYLNINLISYEDNNVWIKVRVLNNKKEIIAESGLIKSGEYLEKIKLNKTINVNDQISYKIMGYQTDSYLSAGSIILNTRIGE